MTEGEARLWAALRLKRLDGLRFRSQHPVGPFILDFYCPRLKLAIEVDGPDHSYRTEEDAQRTEHLASYGVTVLRFTNAEVLNDIQGCMSKIREAAFESGSPRIGG